MLLATEGGVDAGAIFLTGLHYNGGHKLVCSVIIDQNVVVDDSVIRDEKEEVFQRGNRTENCACAVDSVTAVRTAEISALRTPVSTSSVRE